MFGSTGETTRLSSSVGVRCNIAHATAVKMVEPEQCVHYLQPPRALKSGGAYMAEDIQRRSPAWAAELVEAWCPLLSVERSHPLTGVCGGLLEDSLLSCCWWGRG